MILRRPTLFRLASILTALGVVGALATSAKAASPLQGGFTACLASEPSLSGAPECRVIAANVGFMIGVENGDAIISYLDPAPNGFILQKKESVGYDLQSKVADGLMSDDQAAFVFAELLSSHDLFYRVPVDADTLKREVGFPSQAVFSPQDHVDVLISHLQIVLGVGADTADYLVNKLGVQAVEPTETPESF